MTWSLSERLLLKTNWRKAIFSKKKQGGKRMTRLIDMMTEVELSSKVLELFSGSPCLEKGWKRTSDLKQGLEALFAPVLKQQLMKLLYH